MQNRYIGDLGDYGKYGLLKILINSTSLQLGINWCLTPDENNRNDGQKIEYSNYKNVDPDLYEKLKLIIHGNRNIKTIEEKIFNGMNVKFYSATLKDRGKKDYYFNNSFSRLKGSDLLFFDPDNGLEVKSSKSKPFKYVYFDDLNKYAENGYSLIIFQYRDRSEDCWERKFNDLKCKYPLLKIFYLKYSLRPNVYFFMINKNHCGEIEKFINAFRISNWNELFDIREY